MCNSVLACDIPEKDKNIPDETFNEIMITIDSSMTDEDITKKLIYYLENEDELNIIRKNGFEWSQQYIQEYYANRLLDQIKSSIIHKVKVFVIGDELKDMKNKWICDIFKEEFIKYSNLEIVDNCNKADIIWLLAPWSMRKISRKCLDTKFVITTIHHIDWDKFEENKQYYENIEAVTNRYHVICKKTYDDLIKITKKPIVINNFWINENNYFNINDCDKIISFKNKYSIPLDSYIIGSFQKDTEGKDNMTPKLSKGPDIFLKIIEQINTIRKDIFVILTGWRRNYVMEGLNKLGVRYIFFELVDIKTVNELYNCLNLYIVSSRVEGGPRSIIECGLAKIPIISTNVGISELILNDNCIYDYNNIDIHIINDKINNSIQNVNYSYERANMYSIKNYIQTFISSVFQLK